MKTVEKSFTFDSAQNPVHQIADAFGFMERNYIRVLGIHVSGEDWGKLRTYDQSLDVELQKSLLSKGVVGRMWGATIYLDTKLTSGVFRLSSESGA